MRNWINLGLRGLGVVAVVFGFSSFQDTRATVVETTDKTFQSLLDLSTDADPSFAQTMWAVTDKVTGEAVGVAFGTKTGPGSTVLSLSELLVGKVLFSTQGRNVVTLKSEGFKPSAGGLFTLTFLVNGITGKYASVQLNVAREQSGNWFAEIDLDRFYSRVSDSLGRSGTQPFSTLRFLRKTVFGKTVGISRVGVGQ